MSHPNLRPPTQDASNSASGSTTSSDATKMAQGESSSSSTSKKRRVPESVTRNACMSCKKARAKCDGKKPCGRCFSRMEATLCSYEIHIKHAKEELVKQINTLERELFVTYEVLGSLARGLYTIEILQHLKSGESYDKIAEWLAPMRPSEGLSPVGNLSPVGSFHSAAELSDQDMGVGSSTFSWTSVTSDSSILDHLFQLYFAWVHPVHTLFSEGHFVDSFRSQSQIYCSSVLVNAMCAMACQLHSGPDSYDIEYLSHRFYDTAQSELHAQSLNLTTAQAFAVMFLVDCARGQSLRATWYLKIACTSLSKINHMTDEGFSEVLRNTYRGVRCLSIEWGQVTFQVSPPFKLPHVQLVQQNEDERDQARWYFYRSLNDQCPSWPGIVATTNREKGKLLDIVHDVTSMFYSNTGSSIQAHHVLRHYARYKNWREELPEEIGDGGNNKEALPHVLSLLILYSNSVIQLLRPLVEVKGLNHAGIDEVIWKNAQMGLYLLDERYRTRYTCRYQSVPQMFSVLHLCDVIVRFFPERRRDSPGKNGAEAILFGLEAFMQANGSYPIAGIFQELLRLLAVEYSIPLPYNLADLMAPLCTPKQAYRVNDFIEACTRPSYLPPIEENLARFDSKFSAEWDAQSPSQGFRLPDARQSSLRRSNVEVQTAESLMQISSLLN